MTATSIIEYIDQFDGDVRHRLLTVYELIRSAVPDVAVESISWRMPTFKLETEPLFWVRKPGPGGWTAGPPPSTGSSVHDLPWKNYGMP